MNYWLLKSEPEVYSLEMFKEEIVTRWDGVRNYQAKNNIAQMNIGELCLIYHSGKEPGIVGIAEVISKPYYDPSDFKQRFLAVDLQYKSTFSRKIMLSEIKSMHELSGMQIIKQPRLSVAHINAHEWEVIIILSQKQ